MRERLGRLGQLKRKTHQDDCDCIPCRHLKVRMLVRNSMDGLQASLTVLQMVDSYLKVVDPALESWKPKRIMRNLSPEERERRRQRGKILGASRRKKVDDV